MIDDLDDTDNMNLTAILSDFGSRNNSSEAPQKISPRAVRQLRTTALEFGPASSSILASRTAKDRSPKANERRSPRSPASEVLLKAISTHRNPML
ncbi:hypothetical protein U1Q18_033159 [Sarracenia purpurea var. burkii]